MVLHTLGAVLVDRHTAVLFFGVVEIANEVKTNIFPHSNSSAHHQGDYPKFSSELMKTVGKKYIIENIVCRLL